MKRGAPEDPNERRQSRRYSLKLELEWKLIHGQSIPYSGSGHTIDLSTMGILFDAGMPLPDGVAVEISIAWPAPRAQAIPLRLVVLGLVTRSEGRRVAVRISRQEFRPVAKSQVKRSRLGALPASVQ